MALRCCIDEYKYKCAADIKKREERGERKEGVGEGVSGVQQYARQSLTVDRRHCVRDAAGGVDNMRQCQVIMLETRPPFSLHASLRRVGVM